MNIETAVKLWNSAVLNNGADYVLLLPDGDVRFNDKMRRAFVAKLSGKSGLILDGHEAQAILALYSLYAFSDKVIVGSLDLPHGRKLRNLLDCGMATDDELINDVILGAIDGTKT